MEANFHADDVMGCSGRAWAARYGMLGCVSPRPRIRAACCLFPLRGLFDRSVWAFVGRTRDALRVRRHTLPPVAVAFRLVFTLGLPAPLLFCGLPVQALMGRACTITVIHYVRLDEECGGGRKYWMTLGSICPWRHGQPKVQMSETRNMLESKEMTEIEGQGSYHSYVHSDKSVNGPTNARRAVSTSVFPTFRSEIARPSMK
ncbi:hypothetical protein R3P38DRAFT_1202385 [Favolaschia claudopus]|uniref:Uncharacterized protein n=1 Tax=Favolaschia claudopus TaxID=2862362 RepID=A0AAW0B5R8_9AGAR